MNRSTTDTTATTSSAQNQQELVCRPGGLPSIQLPPATVQQQHFYIPPPPMSSFQNWQPQPMHSTTNTQSTSSSEADSKENNRRLSHSTVEKKRREKMNDKIERLKTLIPSCKAQFTASAEQPIHKLSVLQAAIDYIQELHGKLETSLPQDDPILKNLSVVTMRNQSK